jgi:hypothetical protein
MASINKQITQPVDEYLKFVQQSFNTDDFNFAHIISELDAVSKQFAPIMNKRNQEYINRAEKLKKEADKITILKDFNKYNKFDKLGNLGLDRLGLLETYKVSEDIIKDIQVARDWLDSYKEFKKLSRLYNANNIAEATHNELITLGKSILGRAIELTPMKTGFLRESGTLYDLGNYIIIAFTAPYATYVHENLSISHPIHASNPNCGGRAKFLEIALQEFLPDRSVWVETEGFSGVYVKIGLNPLYVEYKHWGGGK